MKKKMIAAIFATLMIASVSVSSFAQMMAQTDVNLTIGSGVLTKNANNATASTTNNMGLYAYVKLYASDSSGEYLPDWDATQSYASASINTTYYVTSTHAHHVVKDVAGQYAPGNEYPGDTYL